MIDRSLAARLPGQERRSTPGMKKFAEAATVPMPVRATQAPTTAAQCESVTGLP
jgi:hypothetical protein